MGRGSSEVGGWPFPLAAAYLPRSSSPARRRGHIPVQQEGWVGGAPGGEILSGRVGAGALHYAARHMGLGTECGVAFHAAMLMGVITGGTQEVLAGHPPDPVPVSFTYTRYIRVLIPVPGWELAGNQGVCRRDQALPGLRTGGASGRQVSAPGLPGLRLQSAQRGSAPALVQGWGRQLLADSLRYCAKTFLPLITELLTALLRYDSRAVKFTVSECTHLCFQV